MYNLIILGHDIDIDSVKDLLKSNGLKGKFKAKVISKPIYTIEEACNLMRRLDESDIYMISFGDDDTLFNLGLTVGYITGRIRRFRVMMNRKYTLF